MSDTASIKLYKLRDNYDFALIEKKLLKEFSYSIISLRSQIQVQNGVEIKAYIRDNSELPDWINLIKPYLFRSQRFDDIKRYSAIIFIFVLNDPQNRCYVITGGSGSHHILTYLNYHFGIEILERIFDPEINKLDAVKEKGVIGDILASSRYYRRSRSIAYEDDFGKYFQDMDIKIEKSQIVKYFPSIAGYKGKSLKPRLTVSCSANIEIKMKINLVTLLSLIKDMVELEKTTIQRIFNRSLIPLSLRKEKLEIIENYNFLRKLIIEKAKLRKIHELDIDICHLDFESFYLSTEYHINVPTLHANTKTKPKYQHISGEDISELSTLDFIQQIYDNTINSIEYFESVNKTLFLKDVFKQISITTLCPDTDIITKGNLVDYIQTEIKRKNSYFLLDKTWYRLQPEFDTALSEKYPQRVGSRIKNYDFYKKWDNMDETQYNAQYDTKANPFYLHLIKVDYIELCDILIVDDKSKKIYILHIKKDIGASIRDLVSQAFISSRIIEEEVYSGKKTRLSKLYEHAIKNERINPKMVTLTKFLQYFDYEREYCLGVYDQNLTDDQFLKGIFDSRIAKFSLIEYSSLMRSNGCEFSITNIPK